MGDYLGAFRRAGQGITARAFDHQPILTLLDPRACQFQCSSHGGKAIRFLHPQFLKARSGRGALRHCGGDEKDRKLIHHRGHHRGIDIHVG